MHKLVEENEQGLPEAMEIDLKCAEKVTDSDVESNADDKVRSPHVRPELLILIKMNSSKCQSGSYQKDQSFYAIGDVTRKPKPINPLHQNDNTIYSPMPMFSYSSPKNPIGVMPFQPKGKRNYSLVVDCFKTFAFPNRRSFQNDASKPQNNRLHPNDAYNQVRTGGEVLVSQ